MSQTPSEAVGVLVDDVIQALKNNEIEKAQVHLSILNQQLPILVNSSSIQSVKVLLDDVSTALKNKNVNSALMHLSLIDQQLSGPMNNSALLNNRGVIASNNSTLSESKIINLSTYSNSTY
jgi:hypothetical protein